MKFQAFNPYLPSWEYIPDAEPHVFGDRLYVYGSHDRFDGPLFCMNDYVCWSAPIDDLSQWRFEGTIYKKIRILTIKTLSTAFLLPISRKAQTEDIISITVLTIQAFCRLLSVTPLPVNMNISAM